MFEGISGTMMREHTEEANQGGMKGRTQKKV